MNATFRLKLPFPPSVNNLFNTVGRRRIPTEFYQAWQRECRGEIMVQKVRPITGPVHVRIDLVAPDNRRRDADNCAKGVIDTLVKAGLIEDDDNRFLRRLNIGWELEGSPCTVTVTSIETMEEAAARLLAGMDKRRAA